MEVIERHAAFLLEGILRPPATDDHHEEIWHNWVNLWEAAGKRVDEALKHLSVVAQNHQVTFEKAHAAIQAAAAQKSHIQLN